MLFLGMSLMFSACVKEDYDNPPSDCDDIVFTKTHTIQELKAMLGTATKVKIDTNIVVSGTVTSTDMHGNIYKELVIEDETGGISIQINASKLYEKYPLGQIVYVNCLGLYIGDSKGVTKLGALYEDNGAMKFGRIADNEFEKYVKRTCDNNKKQPTLISLDDINDSLLYQFVKIDEVQFASPNNTWADGVFSASLNNIIEDKNGKNLIVRTSGYSDFARDSLPKGSGYIQGILGKYETDYQLYVNFKTDAVMDKPRFDTSK